MTDPRPTIGQESAEGVVVTLPLKGGGQSIRAKRYRSAAAIPTLERARAKQVGAQGFWYVPVGDTPAIWWDKVTGEAAVKVQGIVEATGLDDGVTGLLAKTLGIPHGLLVAALVVGGVVVGYGALVQAGIAPPFRKLVQ